MAKTEDFERKFIRGRFVKKQYAGFTIIELIVSIAIFAIIATALLNCVMLVNKSVKLAREKTTLSSLSTYYLEIVRNMPYSQVGTLLGNPHGSLPDLPDAFVANIGAYAYKIYYKVTYVHDAADPGAPGDPSYKQVKMSILNTSNNEVTDFMTTVVPKGLITDPNTGALQITVINSQGQLFSGANVQILYPTSTPYTYNLPDVTNGSGQVTEIGLPAAVNSYRIIATAPGYSTDSTYPVTAQNHNPVHPDATVANGTVTQLTLAIDLLSNLTIKTLDQFCQPLSNVNVNISGAKLIGTSPNVLKYNNNYGSVAGAIALNNVEWDTYTPILLTGQSYIIRGTSPIQAISVLPGTTQTFTMILGPNSTANSLLVIVKDASSGAALENATVTLSQGVTTVATAFTGGSVWMQNDWFGGSAQVQWSSSTPNRYFQDNGNVDTSVSGAVTIKKLAGKYLTATGTLESSTFDTGTGSTNYTILTWQPPSQSASTTLQFQVAANNDNTTWNFVGPDGTGNTYFTTPGVDMGSILDNNRYFRYKVFMSTSDNTKTPSLASVSVNFVTGCFTPGQVIFTGLPNNNTYTLTVSMPGYTTKVLPSGVISGNISQQVLMAP